MVTDNIKEAAFVWGAGERIRGARRQADSAIATVLAMKRDPTVLNRQHTRESAHDPRSPTGLAEPGYLAAKDSLIVNTSRFCQLSSLK